jgi:hypothetical protein
MSPNDLNQGLLTPNPRVNLLLPHGFHIQISFLAVQGCKGKVLGVSNHCVHRER